MRAGRFGHHAVRRGRRLLTLLACLGMLALTGCAAATTPAAPDANGTGYTGSVVDPPLALEDFSLPASTGKPTRLSDFQPRWVLLFFGYTHCPDVCPTTLAEFARVISQLGDIGPQVQVVFVSVDGKRDTPEVLAAYVTRFNSTFIGLQGNDAVLAQIQPQFGLQYAFVPVGGGSSDYTVDHSARTYLIDPQGRLRITYAYGTDRDVLTDSIRTYVQTDERTYTRNTS